MIQSREYQPRSLEIIDTSQREGLQSPLLDDVGKYILSSEERIELLLAQMNYGVRFVEVFSPVINEREGSILTELISVRDDFVSRTGQPVFILAHVRCHPKDVEAALKVGVDGLNFYMGTSDDSQKFGHGKNLDEIVKTAEPLLTEIKRNHPHILRRFSGEDAFRTPIKNLFYVYDPLVELVDRLGTPDTVGVANPQQVAGRVAKLRKRYPNTPLEGHFHNNRGLSLINTLVAVKAGMQYIQTSVLGLGERSGITSLTGLLFNLYLENPKLIEGFNIEQSYALNILLANIIGIQVPITEPVSLTNRTHSAGVHTSAVLKGSGAYEAHDLQRFGVNERRLLLNPLSGWHVIEYYLTNVLNFVGVTEDIAKAITERFKQRTEEIQNGKKPTEFLEEIASDFRLARLTRPVSHEEIL
jgi:homocitrate synthase